MVSVTFPRSNIYVVFHQDTYGFRDTNVVLHSTWLSYVLHSSQHLERHVFHGSCGRKLLRRIESSAQRVQGCKETAEKREQREVAKIGCRCELEGHSEETLEWRY